MKFETNEDLFEVNNSFNEISGYLWFQHVSSTEKHMNYNQIYESNFDHRQLKDGKYKTCSQNHQILSS